MKIKLIDISKNEYFYIDDQINFKRFVNFEHLNSTHFGDLIIERNEKNKFTEETKSQKI